MYISNSLNYLNLTPHDVCLIDPEAVREDRYGKFLLRDEVDFESSILTRIYPEVTPLSVSSVNQIGIVNNTPFYSSIAEGAFNFIIPTDKLEQCDVVIVSQKCAGLLNAKLPFIQSGTQNLPIDPILLDKFYIPYNIVYKNKKPIATLGFQKVTSYLTLYYYYEQYTQFNRQLSLPSLFYVCNQYTSMPSVYRHQANNNSNGALEMALRVLNGYIISRGFHPYPEL